MKFYFALVGLIALSEVDAHRLDQGHKSLIKKMNADETVDDDLSALMDKYDNKEQKQEKKKEVTKKLAKKEVGKPGGPTAQQVQDAELKILEGNNFAEKSEKADEDDQFQEILNKYSSPSKTQKGEQILTQENAQEACNELYAQKKGIDSYDAMDKTKKLFNKAWKEHDINKKGFIDFNEGYSLFQDMLREDE